VRQVGVEGSGEPGLGGRGPGVRQVGVEGSGEPGLGGRGPGVRQVGVEGSGEPGLGGRGPGVRQVDVDGRGEYELVGHGPGVHESGVHKVGVDGPGEFGLGGHGLGVHESGVQGLGGLGVQELGGHPSGDHVVGNQDCVVLDIGGEVGALILYAPAELSGAEVEISLPGNGSRTHSIVRERRVDQSAAGQRTAGRHAAPSGPGDSAVYAAVYPGLPAGVYTIWRDAQTPAGTVQVEGGQVASWLWE
jgi:hypothetical protein